MAVIGGGFRTIPQPRLFFFRCSIHLSISSLAPESLRHVVLKASAARVASHGYDDVLRLSSSCRAPQLQIMLVRAPQIPFLFSVAHHRPHSRGPQGCAQPRSGHHGFRTRSGRESTQLLARGRYHRTKPHVCGVGVQSRMPDHQIPKPLHLWGRRNELDRWIVTLEFR
jgi:hypothetical protein